MGDAPAEDNAEQQADPIFDDAPPIGDIDGGGLFGLPADQPPEAGQEFMPDDGQEFYEDDHINSAEKKVGAFMAKTDGPVTRQQAIEYINLLRWAKEGCSTFVFVAILWISFLLLVDKHSHVQVSYEVYREVTKEVNGIVAKDSQGIAPNAIFSTAGTSMCTCTCPALCGQQGIAGGVSLDGVPAAAPLFNGTVLPEQLQTMRAKAQYLKNLGNKEKTIKLSEVNQISDVWFWLQHGMVPELWHEEARHSAVNATLLFGTKEVLAGVKSGLNAAEKPGSLMRWNQIIGGVRLRQRRLHEGDCRAAAAISGQFHQRCHEKKESVMPFGPGTRSYADGFVPDEKHRGAFDIYLDTERPVHIALETIQYMLSAHNWLDASSQTLQVQVPVINVESTPPLYGLLEVSFKFTRSGEMTKKVDLWTASANNYHGSMMGYLPDMIWAVWLTYLLLKKFYQALVYFCRKRERHDILLNFWFLFDWATLICGFTMIGSWVWICNETGSIGEAIAALPKAPAFDASEVLVKAYHAQWGDDLDRILQLTVLRERLRLAQFGYSMMLIFQFIKAFRGQPKMAQLTRTLINAFEDLAHFAACFFCIFLSFAFTGHLIFGLRLKDWSTSTKCVNASFRALKGDIDLVGMYEVSPVATIIWFWLFLVVIIFIFMNLLLATVYDHYQLVKDKANAFTGIALQTKDALRELWRREGVKVFCCRCCCRCRARDGFPGHAELVEELMARAGYDPVEKHHVFRTVLGPKWMRKKTEKHVFAGEVSAEHIKLDELVPAEQDFKDLNLDQDYYNALLDDAANYRDREYDPEEIHVNQMRELVTLAEVEMAGMRKRLDNCQGHMRLTMHDLARRLETLERCVHTSLGDLVYLAGASGVPDRVEHQPGLEQANVMAKTYERVLAHLGTGVVKKYQRQKGDRQAYMDRMHNARQQNATYGRIHTNARLANAYGEEERKRVARNHAMHV